ncbi:MAG: DsbE family thiol:disulfide interchange protein [Rhodothalassiaceae bacterium]
MNRRPILPLILFGALAIVLAIALRHDPRSLPSALIDRPVPDFALPALAEGFPGLSSADLASGEVTLLNVFASWCAPCRIEHPILTRLAEEGVVLQGLNYKDAPRDALAFLAEAGNPYRRIGADRDGRVAIEFGVYGVPESYVISGDGRILYKHVGPILPQNEAEIRAVLAAARAGGKGQRK